MHPLVVAASILALPCPSRRRGHSSVRLPPPTPRSVRPSPRPRPPSPPPDTVRRLPSLESRSPLRRIPAALGVAAADNSDPVLHPAAPSPLTPYTCPGVAAADPLPPSPATPKPSEYRFYDEFDMLSEDFSDCLNDLGVSGQKLFLGALAQGLIFKILCLITWCSWFDIQFENLFASLEQS